MRRKHLITSAIAGFLALAAQAQIINPSSGGTSPTPAPAPQPNPNGTGDGADNTTYQRPKKNGKSPFGEEIPVYDPSADTVDFMGQKISLADGPWMGQFDAYLSTTKHASDEAAEYRAQIRKILDTISPRNNKMSNTHKLKTGYGMLEKASQYIGDGRICESLGNAIVQARNSKNVSGKNDKEAIKLIEEKEQILRKMKIIENSTDLSETSSPSSKGKGKSGGQQNKRITSSEYINFSKRIVEIDATIKKLSAENTVSETLAKVQYQAMLMQLFMQRRFEHVVMGCRFYNLVFSDGDSKLRIKKNSDLDKLFSKSFGVNPTIAGLDSMANESISKVNTLVDAFRNSLKLNQTHSATKRLVEAFILGEYMPSVQTLSNEEKLKVQKYMLDSKKLVAAADARNVDLVEEMNASLKSQADDYNYAKVDAMVKTAKRVSNQYVFACEDSLSTGDREGFKENFEQAVFYWSDNPMLAELQELLKKQRQKKHEGLDVLANARSDFKMYLQTEQYDKIMLEDNYGLYKMAFTQSPEAEDKVRLAQLAEIKASIIAITEAMKKADAQQDQGMNEAAWETLKQATDRYYDHKGLSQRLTQLNPKVADFISLINDGEQATNKKNLGSALSYYLKAREIHPNSKYANDAIKRIMGHKLKGSSLTINKSGSSLENSLKKVSTRTEETSEG